jgi:hypothetical protein
VKLERIFCRIKSEGHITEVGDGNLKDVLIHNAKKESFASFDFGNFKCPTRLKKGGIGKHFTRQHQKNGYNRVQVKERR